MTIDTETVGLPPVNFVYDIGYTIHDKKGNILIARAFLVAEVITDAKKMMGAFYAKKIFSYYIPALDSQKIKLHSWDSIAKTIAKDCDDFSVDVVTAYNARFDIGAIRSTSKMLGTGKVLKRPVDMLCVWNFACNVLLNRPSYHNIAGSQNWISAAGNVRTTAEHTYRFITGNYDFEETHTALDDALIETEILAKCFSAKKKIPYNQLPSMPWQVAQNVVR